MEIKTSKFVRWAAIAVSIAVVLIAGISFYHSSFQSEVDQIMDFIERYFETIVVGLLVLILFKAIRL